MKLHTVYDIRNAPIITWQVYLFFLMMALALLVFFSCRNNTYRAMKKIRYVSIGVAILSFIIFLIAIADAIRDHTLIKQTFEEKNYGIVEGRVMEYHPMPAGGHDVEEFRVGNLYFTMCDYDGGIMGYNNAASLGGVIKPNLYVRILYPTNTHIAIFRLETE